MFERFTKGARAVVIDAQRHARTLGHTTIGTEHTLLALLSGETPAGTTSAGATAAGPVHAGPIHTGPIHTGPIHTALSDARIDQDAVLAAIIRHVGDRSETAVIADRDAEDAAALKSIGIDLDAVRAAIEENFGAGALHLPRPAPKKKGLFGRFSTSPGHVPFSPRNKKALELSLREAIRLKQNFIAPEHIMLGILREGQGLAALILTERGADFDAVRRSLEHSLKEHAQQA